MPKQILTRAGYEKLQRQLANLQDKRAKLAERLSEDIEYDEGEDEAVMYEAETQRETLDNRIRQLKELLANVEIADNHDVDAVTIGNRVKVRDEDEGDVFDFDLRSSAEIAGGVRGVSADSPVGKALLNQAVGTTVTAKTPDGQARYTILEISPIPEDDDR